MGKRKIMEVGFTIHGDFITNHFRDIVREGNYRGAIEGLKNSLIGLTDEHAYEILSGRKQLVGINTVDYVDDDKHLDPDWLREHYFYYFNRIIIRDDKFYKPYGEVKNLCNKDVDAAMEMAKYQYLPIDKGGLDYCLDFNHWRAQTYLTSPCEDKAFYNNEQYVWILAREKELDYPIWLKKGSKELQTIVNTLTTKEYGFDSYDLDEIDEIREKVKWANTLERIDKLTPNNSEIVDTFLADLKRSGEVDEDKLRAAITEKANRIGGWMNVKNPKTNVEYKLPKYAFYRWVLSDSSAYCQVEWGAVSPRGYKMTGDDPNHTDWWLFTNLDPSLAHETMHPEVRFFYDLKDKTYKKLTNANITPLSKGSHKGFKRAKVVHINTPDKNNYILEDSVIIIPSASPEYELIAIEASKKGCIIISETGGKLCHLATVGREFDICLYMMPNAFKMLPPTSFVKIDTKNDVLDIQHMDAEQNITLKLSGFLYK